VVNEWQICKTIFMGDGFTPAMIECIEALAMMRPCLSCSAGYLSPQSSILRRVRKRTLKGTGLALFWCYG
jgi:hypothetical protein